MTLEAAPILIPEPNEKPNVALTKLEIKILDKLVPNETSPENKDLSVYLEKIARLGGYLARANEQTTLLAFLAGRLFGPAEGGRKGQKSTLVDYLTTIFFRRRLSPVRWTARHKGRVFRCRLAKTSADFRE